MSRNERESEDVQRLLAEGEMEAAERVAQRRLQVRQQREFADLFDSAAAKTPAELHDILRELVTAEIENPKSAYHQKEPGGFFSRLRNDGLVDATVSAISDESPYAWPDMADRSFPASVIRNVLATGAKSPWLVTALELAPVYITDTSEVVGLLAPYLDADSSASRSLAELCPEAAALAEVPWEAVRYDGASLERWYLARFVRFTPTRVAVHLSRLAPDTPGVIEALTDAVGRNWWASSPGSDEDYDLSDFAARVLAASGSRGRSAVPRLRAAAATGDSTAFAAYAALCGDDTEIAALLEEVAATGCETSAFISHSVYNLAPSRPVLVPSVFRLLENFSWERSFQSSNRFSGFDLILFFAEAGSTADAVFPVLAAALDVAGKREQYMWEFNDKAAVVVRKVLDRILNGGPRTDEEAFLAALRGLPPTEFAWLVYADWLDDRGDPRGELVRLRHLCAGEDATDDSRQRLTEWLVTHGKGWGSLYDVLLVPVSGSPPE